LKFLASVFKDFVKKLGVGRQLKPALQTDCFVYWTSGDQKKNWGKLDKYG
jgi:hypothetical protein